MYQHLKQIYYLDSGSKLTNLISGNLRLSNTSGNAGIITSSGQNFSGIITANNIVSYSVPGETVPRFNRITGVSTDGTQINVAGITSVTGVCGGGVLDGLIAGSLDVNDLLLRKTSFDLDQNSFLTPVRHNNIESLDVTTTTVQLRKQFLISRLLVINLLHLMLVQIYFSNHLMKKDILYHMMMDLLNH